jgi:hypothetical protein
VQTQVVGLVVGFLGQVVVAVAKEGEVVRRDPFEQRDRLVDFLLRDDVGHAGAQLRDRIARARAHP